MKKILMLVTFVLVTMVSFSQDYYTSVKNRVGRWNYTYKEFVYSDYITQDIYFSFEKSVIRVSDRTHSTYITSNSRTETFEGGLEMNYYDAVDESSRRCTFIITYKRGAPVVMLSVMYPDIVYEYVCPLNTKR